MTTVLLRRGLEVDRTSITPAEGEPLFCTDTKKLYVGDGTTPGGIEVPNYKGDHIWNIVTKVTADRYDSSNFRYGWFIGFASGIVLMVISILLGGLKC
jgi:hypothetical protein